MAITINLFYNFRFYKSKYEKSPNEIFKPKFKQSF